MPTFTAANPKVISTAGFFTDTFTYDPLYADDVISQSANIAGGLGVLLRGTVLFGPAAGTPITVSTLLTTVATGAVQRCILAVDTDTTAGQVTSLVYTQGKFLDTAMTFSSLGAASDAANLWDFGIYVMTVEQRSGILVPMMKLPTTPGALPQSLAPQDAAQATQEEVAALKAAIAAFRPDSVAIPTPPGQMPAWAIAVFGPPQQTPVEQAKEQAAEQANQLQKQQDDALKQLQAKQAQELSQLLQQQQQQRTQFIQQTQQTLAQAQQATDQAQQQPPTWPQQ